MTKEDIIAECRKEFELHNSEEWERCNDCSFLKENCWKCCSVVMKACHSNGEFDDNVSINRKVRAVSEDEFVADETAEDDEAKEADGTLKRDSCGDYVYDDEETFTQSVMRSSSMSTKCSSGYDDYEGYNGFCGENDW